jgi:hypothetical protein
LAKLIGSLLTPGLAVDGAHLLQHIAEALAVALALARLLDDGFGDGALLDQAGFE